MAENFTVTTERVDDIPVVLAQIAKMGIPDLLDERFEPHGNWRGLSLGWTTAIWLTYILSRGDHRLSWVQVWAAARLQTLRSCTGQPVRELELSDDRLGIVLDELSDAQKWQEFETALNQRTLRVYRLKSQQVRLDSTTASGYVGVTEEGLFQFGHSKDHRPDLPQVKVMLSALDPLGMPLATQVVSGERADDPLYIPAIQQVKAGLEEAGLLYVGDSKMAALATRAFIQAQQDYYLCPLAKKQMPAEVLAGYLSPIWAGELSPRPIYRQNEAGQPQQIAAGYERSLSLSHEVEGKRLTWGERHLIVRSVQHTQALEQALRTRLSKAQAELESLNKPRQGKQRPRDRQAMQQACQAIIKRQRVVGLLQVTIEERVEERRVRAYGGRPATVRTERDVYLSIEEDEKAIEQTSRWFGWRVYATNQPAETLAVDQAVLAYREEYLVERGFGRLKGKPLSLTPMYLQTDQRAAGLIRLLSVGLRILTLLEFQVRHALAEQNQKLAGLYAANPKRATPRPTAEALLEAFKNITLSEVMLGDQIHRHLTKLSELQEKILLLLNFSPNIYGHLVPLSPKPP